LDQTVKEFPFQIELSLRPLLEHLRRRADQGDRQAQACLGPDFWERLEEAPELWQPLDGSRPVARHRDLLDRLTAYLIPPVFWESEPFAAIKPFVMEPFQTSPAFRRLFMDESGRISVRRDVADEKFNLGRVIRVYLFILEKFYDIRQEMQTPFIAIVDCPQTGLERHFQFELDFRFLEVEAVGEPKELSPEERERILDNITRPEVLREILPPQDFRLVGFVMIQAVEVTDHQLMSALTRDLIDQESMVGRLGFGRLQERLRTLFRRPDLVAGLAMIQRRRVLMINVGCVPEQACLFDESLDLPLDEFQGTLYEQVVASDEVINVPDLADEAVNLPRRQEFLGMGLRSLMLAPLHYQGRCVGVLSIKSPRPRDLGVMDTIRLNQVQPLFAMAVQNALDEMDHQVDAVLKEKCTAIHPAVEWRFRQAAFRYLNQRRTGQQAEIEPIVFKGVYPLFGSSDVRGSSEERNRAIAADLAEHLELAREVVERAGAARRLPIFSEVAGRIRQLEKKVAGGLGSGDERLVIGFLRREVESVFDDLQDLGPEVAQAVERYRHKVDPRLGTVYHRRRQFEESVSELSERLAAHLDREEAALQATYPHYFERHRTDGVDYTIYAGSSLMADGRFNRLYLQNLRLWQLMLACGLAWHTEELKGRLHTRLDTAHLVLVQDSPFSIRFRYDEKRFDVEGAYDIQHEIVRSRLDKARVAHSGERLTQPGCIAVVYSQREEALEMRRHLEYLAGQGFLQEGVERLELEEMPGVQGLKALRVAVDLDSEALAAYARAQGPASPLPAAQAG
jgi:GAF domain-containing protein